MLVRQQNCRQLARVIDYYRLALQQRELKTDSLSTFVLSPLTQFWGSYTGVDEISLRLVYNIRKAFCWSLLCTRRRK